MVFHITTIKRKLTKNTRELESLLAKYEGETLRIRRNSETEDQSKELLKSLRDDLPFIRTLSTNIEKLLQDYDSQFSSLSDPTEKEEEEHEKYASKAVDVLTEAERYDPRIVNAITELEKTLKSCNNPDENTGEVESSIQRDETTVKSTIRRLELPTIPIPIFTGDIWEWDNFWKLYNANVHSQDIPDYSKFNYLTSAIQGEASNIIKKYQVSSEGYDLAIQALKNKYGNPQKLIEALVDKLDECSLKAPTLTEERRLFEEIQTIVAQLVKKGQDVDNQWMIKNTMSKFPRYIRNKVLDKQEVGPNEGPLNMQTLLQYLEEIITKEERKASYKFEKEPKITRTQRNTAQDRSCMYCRGEHKAFYCDTYATAKERLDYLLKNKLCTICASSQHSTSQCYKSSCHSCQGRHHTSCCTKSNTKDRNEEQPEKDKNERNEFKQNARKPKVNVSSNQLSLEPDTHDKQINATTETMVQTEDNEESPLAASLPLGNLKIVEPVKGDLKTIPVVLDSGSGLSFIETKLADELKLPTIGEVKLIIRTFGSKKKLITSSRKVKLVAWDVDGKQITLYLFTNDEMTSPCQLPQLTTQDKEFMKQHNYIVEYPYDGKDLKKPSISIGSNLLWKLMKKDQRSTELPSGLDILSTRLGYCITGKVDNADIEYAEQKTWQPATTEEIEENVKTPQEKKDRGNEKNVIPNSKKTPKPKKKKIRVVLPSSVTNKAAEKINESTALAEMLDNPKGAVEKTYNAGQKDSGDEIVPAVLAQPVVIETTATDNLNDIIKSNLPTRTMKPLYWVNNSLENQCAKSHKAKKLAEMVAAASRHEIEIKPQKSAPNNAPKDANDQSIRSRNDKIAYSCRNGQRLCNRRVVHMRRKKRHAINGKNEDSEVELSQEL